MSSLGLIQFGDAAVLILFSFSCGTPQNPRSGIFRCTYLSVHIALHLMSYPVLGAVGVNLQGVEALWCARDLSFDFSTQQTVRHKWTFTYS